ncbi:MAG TPA: Flp family type IVb pilin [Feifaniaceae bacterium]|nr:Flp family type IVb pilin [Feifaniaceae bacterium]
MKKLIEILKDENGQGMVEYGLILGLIAIAAITVLIALGPRFAGIFNGANDTLNEQGFGAIDSEPVVD